MELGNLDAALLALHASSGNSTTTSSRLPSSIASGQTYLPAFQQPDQGWNAKRRRVSKPEGRSEDAPGASTAPSAAGLVTFTCCSICHVHLLSWPVLSCPVLPCAVT